MQRLKVLLDSRLRIIQLLAELKKYVLTNVLKYSGSLMHLFFNFSLVLPISNALKMIICTVSALPFKTLRFGTKTLALGFRGNSHVDHGEDGICFKSRLSQGTAGKFYSETILDDTVSN